MNIVKTLLGAVIVLGLINCGPSGGGIAEAQQTPPQPGDYRLDQRHASLVFRVNHMGLARTVGRFNGIEATLDLNTDAPEQSRITAVIDAASVDSGLSSFDTFLRSNRFLDTAAHPQIRFVSRSVERTGDRAARITGDLTMHGVTRSVTLDAVLNGAGPHPFDGRIMAGFSATTHISRAQFGLNAFPEQVGDAEFARS
jgi:polyisoprenoid-binding protein YceI